MTENGNLKRRVRARAARTGESYTAALRHIRQPVDGSTPVAIRLAVAQTSFFNDPRDIKAIGAVGDEMRGIMEDARSLGARVIHFPEGATCAPNKRIMSATGPAEVGPADWSRFEWTAMRQELAKISALAKALKIWVVFGSVHQLTAPHRPHNSLYVISDKGELATRYDERMLSNTKISWMYSPGKGPITFEVDGVRFGCALGIETHYPELFIAYEKLDVDCVLFSTAGELAAAAPAFAAEVLGHAASNSYWVSYSAHSPQSAAAPAGIAAPDGRWAAQCPADGSASVVVANMVIDRDNPARPWRQKARGELDTANQVATDPRSMDRSVF